jgi:hypothetical protein
MAVQKQDGLHTDVAESAADLRGKETRFCSKGADGRVNVSGAGAYIDGVISEGKDGRVRNPVGAAGELAEIHPTRILDAVDDVV